MSRRPHRAETRQARTVTPATGPTIQALFNSALQHHQAGRPDEAERLYRQVLAVHPRHADSLHLRGVIALQNGRPDLAIDLIGQAIAIQPNEPTYHSNLATALWKQGRAEAAIDGYRRALALKPDYLKAHFNLALVLQKQGRPDEADTALRAALFFKPDYAEAYDALGTARKAQGQFSDAISYYRRAIHFRADFVEAHNNLGTALWEQGQLDDSVACYRRALELNPHYAEAHFNLGIALWELGQLDAAIICYQQALRLNPGHADAHNNLGTALKEQGRLHEAVASYRRALALKPDDAEAHSNLGIALLALGDLAVGWAEHEWRWRTPQLAKARRDFAQPQWRGEAAAGRTLLIHAEQGFGDTLQFCRYAPLVAARGCRVVMEVQAPLVRLLQRLPGVAQVVARGEDLPPFDCHCPMMSLPLAMDTTMATIPAGAPYLAADPTDAMTWWARLNALPGQGPRVGLAWAGSPRSHSRGLAAVDRRRSMTPDRLAPLLALPGVRFFSLQKDGPAVAPEQRLIDLMAEMRDFADTAALIANLDLVVTVDTAVAHLAAGLGKPVWLLDRFDPCWRWFTGRRDSPWYPTLRLYRQPRPGDWEAVIAAVAGDLSRLAAGAG